MAESLGDLAKRGCIAISTGPFGSALHAHDYRDTGVPVIPTEAIEPGRIRHDRIVRITEQKARELTRHRLQLGDIVFARRGVQACGISAPVTMRDGEAIAGTGIITLRILAPDVVDPAFLAHAVGSEKSVTWLKRQAIGATMPNLNSSVVLGLPICLPDIQVQRVVARILGAFDDKIELNRNIRETLETMARAVFKAWFVDFDPVRTKAEGAASQFGHEITSLFPDRFENSNLGPIPHGWRAVSLTEAIEVNPLRILSKGNVAPYLDMANMPTHGHSPEMIVERPAGSGMRFMNGDTLLARITPCLENGKTSYVDFLEEGQVGWGSTEYIVLHPKSPLPEEFGYCLARSDGFREFAIQSMTGSSGRQRVPTESLSHYLIALPPESIAKRFGSLVRPIFVRASNAVRESRTLADLRDSLLPRLVSGEIRLSNLEHFFRENDITAHA